MLRPTIFSILFSAAIRREEILKRRRDPRKRKRLPPFLSLQRVAQIPTSFSK